MIYMTLILASMIIIYKNKNDLKEFKIVKMKIAQELKKMNLLKKLCNCQGVIFPK